MDKKIIVTLLFFIFSTGCAVTGTYVHDSKSEEDYSHDYRECADKALVYKSSGAAVQFMLHKCMEHDKGWSFVDEQGNYRHWSYDRRKGKIWSPKNKLSEPSTIFKGF